MPNRTEWEAVADQWLRERPDQLWRSLHNSVNRRLLDAWVKDRPARSLKTDLFDEAVSSGLLDGIVLGSSSSLGMDTSLSIAARARDRESGTLIMVSDVRKIPLADRSHDLIISNSTLDHFVNLEELQESLRELHRILGPKGELILTMDNLANPVVALRNALPFSWLRLAGILPYPVGVTGGPRTLRRLLQGAGFEVIDTCAIAHCPRWPAVRCASLVESTGSKRGRRWLSRLVLAMEVLDRLPTRYLTGYFVALRARRASTEMSASLQALEQL